MRFLMFVLISSIFYSQDYISKTETKIDINLRSEASLFSSSNGQTILKNNEVIVLDFKNDYWLIKKDSVEGWCSKEFLYKTDSMLVIIKRYKNDLNIKKFGLRIGEKINSHQIWIGMTKNMLLASYGEPKSKNITRLKNYLHEQWVYSSIYIYLDNEIVTSIQSK